MSVRAPSVVVICAAVVGLGYASEHTAGAVQLQEPEPELAIAIARSGLTAGFVVRLPDSLDEQLARAERTASGLLMNRSGFGLWLRSTRTEGTSALRTQADVRRALEAFAEAAAPQTIVDISSAATIPMLKTAGTAVCQARLRVSAVRAPIEGTFLLDVLSLLAKIATGADVPRGFVGSCIGTNDFVEQPFFLAPGDTFESGLNQVVQAFGSSVWVVVQGGANQCSLGIIRRAQGGGVCTAAITANLPK